MKMMMIKIVLPENLRSLYIISVQLKIPAKSSEVKADQEQAVTSMRKHMDCHFPYLISLHSKSVRSELANKTIISCMLESVRRTAMGVLGLLIHMRCEE